MQIVILMGGRAAKKRELKSRGGPAGQLRKGGLQWSDGGRLERGGQELLLVVGGQQLLLEVRVLLGRSGGRRDLDRPLLEQTWAACLAPEGSITWIA